LGSILLLRISAHASVFTYYYDFNGAGRQKGFGITANMPTCAVDFIARHQLTGHAFVSYPFASLLIYRMHPVVKVNMDSRNKESALLLLERYEEAIATTRQILARDPANVTLYADMGQAFLRLGQQERATEMYEKALKISPEFAPAREKLQEILGLDE
jgi:tetratricopeptide (TPR) repeat protein